MNIMLTSFGTSLYPDFSVSKSPFYRMPPVFIKDIEGHFQLDFPSLLLADNLIIDTATLERLQETPHPAYSRVAETLSYLVDTHYVNVVDYEGILMKRANVMQEMVELDCTQIDQWYDIFYEAYAIWKVFQVQCTNLINPEDPSVIDVNPHFWGFPQLVRESRDNGLPKKPGGWSASWKGIAEYISGFGPLETAWPFSSLDYISKEELDTTIRQYLAYVNSNLILSHELDSHPLDWEDFDPFYRRKFLSARRDGSEDKRQIDASSKLFEISFPELKIRHVEEFLSIVEDKRIAELRSLIQQAAQGDIEFDEGFANAILQKVKIANKKVSKYRKIACYATLPLTMIPILGSIAQKVTEDVAGAMVDRVLRKDLKWFYLLQEMVPLRPIQWF